MDQPQCVSTRFFKETGTDRVATDVPIPPHIHICVAVFNIQNQ